MPQEKTAAPSEKPARRPHTVHLEPQIYERVSALAQEDDRSFNNMVNRLLGNALDAAEKAS